APGIAGGGHLLFRCSADESEEELKPRRDEEDPDYCQRPILRFARKRQPAQHHQQKGGWFNQAAPEVVENLPLRNQRDRVWHKMARLIRYARREPVGDLPVSS